MWHTQKCCYNIKNIFIPSIRFNWFFKNEEIFCETYIQQAKRKYYKTHIKCTSLSSLSSYFIDVVSQTVLVPHNPSSSHSVPGNHKVSRLHQCTSNSHLTPIATLSLQPLSNHELYYQN